MKFTVVVHAAPQAGQSAATALRFCQELLQQGHALCRVFFFRDGVLNGNRLSVFPQDETDLCAQWENFLSEHDIEAVACVTSALRRGMLDEQEAQRHDKPAAVLSSAFRIGGLGELVDACSQSDRVVNFG